MSSSENLRAIQKSQPIQGFCFDFINFLIKFYLKVLLRMQGSCKRFKQLKASIHLTQMGDHKS